MGQGIPAQAAMPWLLLQPILTGTLEMNATWFLQKDIYFCNSDGAFIFLDAGRNRYFRLTRDQSRLFQMLGPDYSGAPGANALVLAERLVRRGILTPDAQQGKLIEATAQSGHLQSAITDTGGGDVSMMDVAAMARVVSSIWLLQKTRSFAQCLQTARKWKAKPLSVDPPDPAQTVRLCTTFLRLCPFFFTQRDACRFRSLCLVRYLTLSGINPNWVFGVRLDPFGAHCWVEHNGQILNEAPDTVREYRRILCV